jgi:hypothetical protein
MFTKEPLHVGLKLRVFIRVFLLSLLVFSIVTSVVTIVTPSTFAIAIVGGNKPSDGATTNITFVGNMMPKQNMTMPGGNMTNGSSNKTSKNTTS